MSRLLTLMLLCLPFPIFAATHCVDNAAALGIALDSVGASAEADSIRIVRGSINMWTAEEAQIRGALTISGGWFPGCALRDATSASTISGLAAHAFVLRPMDADLTLERLNFANWREVLVWDYATSTAIIGGISVSRCAFRNADRGLYLHVASHQLKVENSLFVDNAREGLRIWRTGSLAGMEMLSQFNSHVGNGTGIFISNYVADSRVRILNTVSTLNRSFDLDFGGEPVQIRQSLWNSWGNGTLTADSSGNRSGNAGLDANLSPASGSQLIDNAVFDFFNRPTRDHTGAPRSSGARPDIGAYERTAL